MWMLHFLSHLKEGGTAGFVMATGELSNSQIARLEVRKSLVEGGYVDCIVQLSGQLFANTQIPCTLWFLSKNRHGEKDFRPRTNEILFVDARKLGALLSGSRKQKALSDEDLEQVAAVYRQFKHTGTPDAVPGFCRAVLLEDVRGHNHTLTPGRYVGSSNIEDEDDIGIEEKIKILSGKLREEFAESNELEKIIDDTLVQLNFNED
jgi:type I restriction enzyme M protein